MSVKKLAAAVTLATLSLNAFAEGDELGIKADVELGFISTTGNTESESLIGKINVKQNLTGWRNTYILETLFKNDTITNEDTLDEESTRTAQRLFVSAQGDYKLDDKYKAVFIYGSYEDDRFSGFDYQGVIAAGFTDRLFENAKSHLNYAVGPGISFTKTDDVEGVEGETDESFIVRLSLEYLYQFNDNVKFTQTLGADIAGESDANTRVKAESALTANLNSSLALKASFLANHNTEVDDAVEKTDTQTAVTLVYTF